MKNNKHKKNLYLKIRKYIPPPTRVIPHDKEYNRKKIRKNNFTDIDV
jgi:hypothetical protein